MTVDAAPRDVSDAEDLEKVRAYLAGDEAAFEHLFDKHRDRVYSIAYRHVNDKEDALDIVQEVFIRVAQGLRKFKTDSKFSTWLYRITVNRSIDFLRSRKARPAVEFSQIGADEGDGAGSGAVADSFPNASAVDPSRAAEEQELAERVRQAVERLPEKHRTVFVLHAYEQLTYKEIGEVVGCAIGTVMSRLFYARKKLQEILALEH